MIRNYFLSFLITLACLTTLSGVAQNDATSVPTTKTIEDLIIYPNPVSNGQTYVYITSRLNLNKTIEVYNVLGKQILNTDLSGKELNISSLSKGVYILKITENNISETRKLIIK